MKTKNHFIIIAVVLAVVGSIWIYTFGNHHRDDHKSNHNKSNTIIQEFKHETDKKSSKNTDNVKNRKFRINRIVSSGKGGSSKRKPAVPVTISVSDSIADLQFALASEDEKAIEKAVEALAGCSSCMDQLKDILDNPSHDEDIRKHAAMALLKSGKRDGVLAVLDLLVITGQQMKDMQAREEENMSVISVDGLYEILEYRDDGNDMREEFLRMLVETDSLENVPILLDVLTGKEDGFGDDFIMPDDMRHAMMKAVRLRSDQHSIGELLAGRYKSESSPEIKSELIGLRNPAMNALLALEAYKKGDNEEAQRFTDQLENIEDVNVIDGIMFLTRESHVPVIDVADMLYQWAERFPDARNYDVFGQYLQDASKSPEERAISAYALSAMTDSNKALDILEEVYNIESDPLVLNYIELAFDEIDRRIDESEI